MSPGGATKAVVRPGGDLGAFWTLWGASGGQFGVVLDALEAIFVLFFQG